MHDSLQQGWPVLEVVSLSDKGWHVLATVQNTKLFALCRKHAAGGPRRA